MVVESNFRRDIENTMQCRNSFLMRTRMGHMQNDTIVIMQLETKLLNVAKNQRQNDHKTMVQEAHNKNKNDCKLRLQVKERLPKSKLR